MTGFYRSFRDEIAAGGAVEEDGTPTREGRIMGLLMLAAGPGSRLMVEANGGDADQAVNEIEALIRAKFGEE